ncbi:cancer-related nucleoside-triphosphatase homolog isoform X2 [Plodia interpunctella]|uniref:cancer-related nucleoside-triphosphatase homolog isoform X2 n=1 Tax=Plodia interpunctella TaxID=58824 RepID=UPI0023682E30|nr:cancer-related nucleoside-triphosphatase homolog isoform X2 [Plodia interpunctella]
MSAPSAVFIFVLVLENRLKSSGRQLRTINEVRVYIKFLQCFVRIKNITKMANTKFKYFILTGDPGVGKTTLTKKIASCLRETGISTSGFYTEEVRRNRVREGFDVVTLDGDRGRLAREESLLNSPVKHRVGKYGVTIQEFENLALPSLEKVNTCSPHLLVIDEIGNKRK